MIQVQFVLHLLSAEDLQVNCGNSGSDLAPLLSETLGPAIYTTPLADTEVEIANH